MLDLLFALRRAYPAARTAGHCLVGLAHHRRPAHRALFGSFTGAAPATRRSGTILTTSGITSPARRMTTVSPTRTSLRVSSSMLCNVALLTVTPPTNTGSSRATGVNAPVRPT